MKFTKLISALAVAGAATLGGVAHAAPTISNLDGTLTPFGGFDWVSGAAAWTAGYTGAANSTFTLYYAADAGYITNGGGINLTSPRLDNTADGVSNSTYSSIFPGAQSYEYTIFASLTEKVISCDVSFTTCTFQVTGGNFDIYYDTAANAKESNGTGYLDGTRIISGNVNAGPVTTFTAAIGSFTSLTGAVTYTNATYVNPQLAGSTLTSTLQLGAAQTGFTQPTGFDFDNNGTSDPLNNGKAGSVIIFQADANQSFTAAVPEPSSIALVASGLIAVGALTRRRKNKV